MTVRETQQEKQEKFIGRHSDNRALDVETTSAQDSVGQGVTLEIIDRTFLDFIDNYINAEVRTNNGFEKVKVLFSSKERWAQIRNYSGIRDKHGRLILPLIAITRTSNEINLEAPYSELNKISIYKRVNPKSLYSKQEYTYEDTQPGLARPREIDATRQKPFYDFISFPNAKSIKLTYEVSFWTDYMVQSNSIFEKFVNNIERQIHYIFSENGFRFPVKLSNVVNDSNVQEYSDEEKIIRQTVGFELEGYLVDSTKIRKERSSIDFVLSDKDTIVKKKNIKNVFPPELGLNRKKF